MLLLFVNLLRQNYRYGRMCSTLDVVADATNTLLHYFYYNIVTN